MPASMQRTVSSRTLGSISTLAANALPDRNDTPQEQRPSRRARSCFVGSSPRGVTGQEPGELF